MKIAILGRKSDALNYVPTADKNKNNREAGTSMKNKGSAAVSGAKSNRKLTISVDLNPTTV